MRRLLAVVPAVVLVAGCSAPSFAPEPPPFAPRAGSASAAPYDAPPVASARIAITIDMRAAREILALLGEARFSSAAAKQLETLPAVELAITDSNRPPETFERDLAAAFDEQTRPSVFDFRRVRDDRARWQELIALISSREADLTRMASDRARALIPPDRPISVTLPIYLTFGLASRADHIALPGAGGTEWGVVIDLSRALADSEASAPSDQIKSLSRLVAAEASLSASARERSITMPHCVPPAPGNAM